MANGKPPSFVTATLDKFLGLYTEADPTSLPEGASPLTINCDYDIGNVHQRPGKESVYYFENEFVEKIAGFAQNFEDASNELAWTTPLNATRGIAGTYASVALTTPIGAVAGILGLDSTDGGETGTTTPMALQTLTPSGASAYAFFNELCLGGGGIVAFTPNAGWASEVAGFDQTVNGPISAGGTFIPGTFKWAALEAIFKIQGSTPPTLVQSKGATLSPTFTIQYTNPVVAGNVLLLSFQCGYVPGLGDPPLIAVTDNLGNNWELVAQASNNSGGGVCPCVFFYAAFNALPGQPTVQVADVNNPGLGSGTIGIFEFSVGSPGQPSLPFSQQLQAFNFPFTIPETVGVIGFEVEVTGKQTSQAADAVLTLSFLNPTADTPTQQFQLSAIEGQVVMGQPTSTWGFELTPDLLNNPNFGVQIQASSPTVACTFDISAVKLKVFLTPNPAPDFNYIKTYEEEGVFDFTLALDSSGTMWQEDVLNNPGALNAVYQAIEPNTFAQSVTLDAREFIALSDLLEGTDIPYTYNGTNFDRCSQVGPGAAPTATTSTSGSTITSITQNAAHTVPVSSHSWTLVSASPRDIGSFGLPSTPGNVLTLIFPSGTPVPAEITPGSSVVLAGFPNVNGFQINNDPAGIAAPKFYTVTSVGQPIPGQLSYDAFTVTVTFTTFYNQETPGGCTYQSTTATMTTAAQVPNLEVGNTFAVSGTGGAPPAGYDSSWTVTATPNASQLQITATSLTNNVATYSYNLVSGTNPVTGQFVSVIQTLNGNGIFNVTRAIISSASAGTFSIGIVSPTNIASAAEDGAGVIFGTIFQFDAFTIVGNKTGGSIVSSGIIAAGIRQICYSFLTRNGYITAPSPIATSDITAGANGIAIANFAVGPSNVIARIIHLTPANGGQFYNIPEPVSITDLTGTVINTSTYVRDNTTTNVLLSFSDEVLVTATEIDVQGNNLFETVELGSSVGFVEYSNRVFAIGEENKVSNFLNWSFDGGTGVVQSTAGAGGGAGTNSTYPLGWTVDLVNGTGGAVVSSPIFGSAYQISNTTGSTQAVWGMITQPAFQDEFQVPIINASTTYSVRVTASVPTGATTGNLVVDLYSPSTGRALGAFTLPLATLGTTMAIFRGTLLTQTLAPVPGDLLLRLYATSIQNGVTITIDREEVYPTEEPVLSTQITGSYAGNFEAFDQNTGPIICSIQNQQAVKSAFTLFDNLYVVKFRSLLSTQDNGTTEPNFWTTRVVSNVVGTTSIYGVDSGEDWALIFGQPGLFIFDGGTPIRISSEIQKLLAQVNWTYGHTVWVKNDIVNQRILLGVPMKTPNIWLPTGIVPDNANPTTPNIVLMLNYKQLNTGPEVAERIGVHSSSFTGKLLATDTTRKWSVWSIQAPCAAFVTRPDTTQELFIGNSAFTGKIYQLVENLMEDDGAAIDQRYCTYPFISPEQEQQFQMGAVQKQFGVEYMPMRMNVTGAGSLQMTVFLNTLTGPYTHDLLPNLDLPASSDGDAEIPLNEAADRMFLQLRTNAVGAAFQVSKVAIPLRAHPWAQVRGRN